MLRWSLAFLATALLSSGCGLCGACMDVVDGTCVGICGGRSRGSGSGSIGGQNVSGFSDVESGFYWTKEGLIALLLRFADGTEVRVFIPGKDLLYNEGTYPIPSLGVGVGNAGVNNTFVRRIEIKPAPHPPIVGGTLRLTRVNNFRIEGDLDLKLGDGTSLTSGWTLRNLKHLDEPGGRAAGGGGD